VSGHGGNPRSWTGPRTYGAPDTSARVTCPYCGAEVELILDPDGGATQRYVEDCEVCCRPWQLTVRWDRAGAVTVEARTDDD